MGCPQEYALVLVAERFGVPPWDMEDAPADRFYFYMRVLSIEAEIKELLADLDPDEPLIREE